MARQRSTQKLYLHPLVVRLTHWLNAIALTVMVLSGLRIFWAYQGFNLSTRVDPRQVYDTPAVIDLSEGLRLHPAAPADILVPVRFSQSFYDRVTLGGWLGGALRWHSFSKSENLYTSASSTTDSPSVAETDSCRKLGERPWSKASNQAASQAGSP